MPSKRSWTDKDLEHAVSRSMSHSGVLKELGLKLGGGTFRFIKDKIKFLGFDTSHFTGLQWRKGLKGGGQSQYSLEEILIKGSMYRGIQCLKKRLLNAGLLQNKCYMHGCEPVWFEKPLVLRLDHINGDNTDHRIENLRLLCPNCDSQTPTFCGRNKSNNVNVKKEASINEKRQCVACQLFFKPKSSDQVFCSKSCVLRRPKFSVSKVKLQNLVWKMPTTKIAKSFGVSDSAISKRCKKLGITKPPRGYWAKQKALIGVGSSVVRILV